MATTNGIISLRDLFAEIAATHGLYFVFGGDEETLVPQRKNDLVYPMLVCEFPTITFVGQDPTALQSWYNCTLSVIASAKKADLQDRVTQLAATEIKLNALMVDLVDRFGGSGQVSASPITGFTHDNLFGWQIKFNVPTSLC